MTETIRVYNVARGTTYLASQQVIIYATSLLFYILVFRVLNLSEIGQVSILGATLGVFTTLTQLALPVAATRFISSSLGRQDLPAAASIAKTSLRLVLSISTPALALAILFSPMIGGLIFSSPSGVGLLITTFLAGFLLDITTLYGAYFLGMGKYARVVYQNILFIPLSRTLGLLLAYIGYRVEGIVLGWAIGAFATLLLSLGLWRNELASGSMYPIGPLVSFSLPLFASAVITLLQGWGDITLLQGILGQFGTTGAYYIVVSSVGFLSILWTPTAGALYPALSSRYTSNGPQAVSAKLGIAMRLVNLTVLPTGAALATVAPTALEAVYGSTLGNQAIPFAILAVTIIFSAQSLLLITTLQAVGNTKPILGISLAATIIDLAAVGLGARLLGTTAGALGRALLAIGTMLLAWQSLRHILPTPVTKGLGKAMVLAATTAGLLATIDHLLAFNLHYSPLARVPMLTAAYAIGFLAVSRALSVFTADDFDLLENALPRFLNPVLRVFERLLVPSLEFL